VAFLKIQNGRRHAPILCEIHISSYMNDNKAHFGYVNYIFYQSTSQDRNADEINSADYEKK